MEGRTLLSLLHGLPKGLKNGVKDSEALGGAVIACAVKAVSVGLEAERKEHVRSYTSARQVVALGTFATAVTQVVALAHKWPLLLPVAGGLRNKPLRDKLTAELTAALEPPLPSRQLLAFQRPRIPCKLQHSEASRSAESGSIRRDLFLE